MRKLNYDEPVSTCHHLLFIFLFLSFSFFFVFSPSSLFFESWKDEEGNSVKESSNQRPPSRYSFSPSSRSLFSSSLLFSSLFSFFFLFCCSFFVYLFFSFHIFIFYSNWFTKVVNVIGAAHWLTTSGMPYCQVSLGGKDMKLVRGIGGRGAR